MPELILRRNAAGALLCYVAKRDLEAAVLSVEHDAEDRWGGTLSLANGERFFIEPRGSRPVLPVTLRANKV
ncbi:putative nitrogen fixation protein NifT [Candidatus Magnetaquicoccus inordinatus]|uniref:putative nitrogen fixation protein NifT n=1 Tax=Candidatus Magnetaquicoccus inordinatus TaxID=2496818 RepID=UPI00102C84C8|nr:putative nitrogen fixation protein NifT [Candidatus Magnetaquicoccus inordinatus]